MRRSGLHGMGKCRKVKEGAGEQFTKLSNESNESFRLQNRGSWVRVPQLLPFSDIVGNGRCLTATQVLVLLSVRFALGYFVMNHNNHCPDGQPGNAAQRCIHNPCQGTFIKTEKLGGMDTKAVHDNLSTNP